MVEDKCWRARGLEAEGGWRARGQQGKGSGIKIAAEAVLQKGKLPKSKLIFKDFFGANLVLFWCLSNLKIVFFLVRFFFLKMVLLVGAKFMFIFNSDAQFVLMWFFLQNGAPSWSKICIHLLFLNLKMVLFLVQNLCSSGIFSSKWCS